MRQKRFHAEQERLTENSPKARIKRDYVERAIVLAEWENGPHIYSWIRADAMLDAVMHLLATDECETFFEPDAVHNLRTRSEQAIKRFLEDKREKRKG